MDKAPDFIGNYPSRGEFIGPAWQIAWFLLSDGNWHLSDDLANSMCSRVEIQDKTAKNLLRSARRARILNSELRLTEGRHRTWYQIAK